MIWFLIFGNIFIRMYIIVKVLFIDFKSIFFIFLNRMVIVGFNRV